MHWSDFGTVLMQLGIETETAFLRCEALRRATEMELGMRPTSSDAEHLKARISRMRPSTVLFASHQGFRQFGGLVRDTLEGCGVDGARVGFHATYSGNLNVSVPPDFVLAATPGIRTVVRRLGAPTELWYLLISNRTSLVRPGSPEFRSKALTFVGNNGFWDSRYRWRAAVLGTLGDRLEQYEGYHFGPRSRQSTLFGVLRHRTISRLSAAGPTPTRLASRLMPGKLAGQAWAESASGFVASRPDGRVDARLVLNNWRWRRRDVSEASPGIFTDEVLQDSVITVNAHGDTISDVGNMRMFEATAAGACLLTDTGSNLVDLFSEDEEVVTFRSPDEAVKKATYLMENPTVAAAIAAAGQRRYERSHSPKARARELIEILGIS
jgi:hypothetical protein